MNNNLPLSQRVRIMEQRLASLERTIQHGHNEARGYAKPNVRVAQTCSTGGTYPTSGNAFGIKFVDCDFDDSTDGTKSLTGTLQSATYQRIARTIPSKSLANGTDCLAVEVDDKWYIIGDAGSTPTTTTTSVAMFRMNTSLSLTNDNIVYSPAAWTSLSSGLSIHDANVTFDATNKVFAIASGEYRVDLSAAGYSPGTSGADGYMDLRAYIFPMRSSATFGSSDVNTTTDQINIPSHGFSDGAECFFTTTGTLPGGLTVAGSFQVDVIDADHIAITTESGLSAVDITSTGSGTHTIRVFGVTSSVNEIYGQVTTYNDSAVNQDQQVHIHVVALSAGAYVKVGFYRKDNNSIGVLPSFRPSFVTFTKMS